MAVKTNLVVGQGTLYTAATGEALPELDDMAPPLITVTPGGNWVAIGATADNEPSQFEYTPTWEPVRTNQDTGPIKLVLTAEEALFKVKFAEHDFLAWSTALKGVTTLETVSAGADQTAQDIIPIGSPATVNEIALLWTGTNPESGTRVIHIPFAVATAGTVFGFDKVQTVYDVEWTALTDPTATAGERMAKMYDVTAVASS